MVELLRRVEGQRRRRAIAPTRSATGLVLVLVLGVGLLACDADAGGDEGRDAVSAPSKVDATLQAFDRSETAGDPRSLRRGRIVGGEPLPRTVRWPRSSALNLELQASLPEQVRAALPLSPAPVLLPDLDAWASEGRLHTGPTWSAFEAHRDSLHVNVSASTQARLYPGINGVGGMPDLVRGLGAIVTRNEGIWSASWIEYGVAYAIEVECGADDSRCDDDAYLRELAESLTWVGGGPGQASNEITDIAGGVR